MRVKWSKMRVKWFKMRVKWFKVCGGGSFTWVEEDVLSIEIIVRDKTGITWYLHGTFIDSKKNY